MRSASPDTRSPVSRAGIRRLLRTASFRLAALYVAMFVISACVLGTAMFLAARSALDEQMSARIQSETQFLTMKFGTGGLDHLLPIIRAREQGIGALDYLAQRADGTRLAGEMPTAPREPGWTVVHVPHTQAGGGRPDRIRVLVSDLGDGVLLAVGVDLRSVIEAKEAIATAFLGTVGLAVLLGIGGGVLLSRAFLLRVDAISRTAEAIIGGDLTQRIPLRNTGDDLDRLAATLNRMLDRITALMESLRQVSSDVAHDLRTPLSRLFQRLEHARSHARSIAEYEVAVDGALREAEGLLDTFSALLRIAQVEGASPSAGFRDVDLGGVVEAIADAYRPDAEDAGHILISDVTPGLIIHGDQELLTQATANLVENALRHTPVGTRIAVRLSAGQAAGLCLVVEDDGPGVRGEDLPRLADRFYRGERSRTTPGNGLGLCLVAAVAELHGARLQLADARPGLRATLLFPACQGRPDHPVHHPAAAGKPWSEVEGLA